jgi:hypothetical protein
VDKGHHEPMNDVNREPYIKELHPKQYDVKTQSSPKKEKHFPIVVGTHQRWWA